MSAIRDIPLLDAAPYLIILQLCQVNNRCFGNLVALYIRVDTDD